MSTGAVLERLVAHAAAARKLVAAQQARKAPTTKGAAKDAEARLSNKLQLDRHLHEIHCLAVELGLAEPQPYRYGEKRIAIGFGREQLELRRAPGAAS